jgi:hypothetical protein
MSNMLCPASKTRSLPASQTRQASAFADVLVYNRLVQKFVLLVVAMMTIGMCVGCANLRSSNSRSSKAKPPTQLAMPTTLPAGVDKAKFFAELDASPFVPTGWLVQPLKKKSNSTHTTWVSPTGRTAYGVIYFRLPLPVGAELAFRYGFLPAMRQAEGEAKVLEQKWDAASRSLRFVVEGGQYKLRSIMVVRGLSGWTYYAGTLRSQPEDHVELKIAEDAKELSARERAE